VSDGRTIFECVFIGLALLGMIAGWFWIVNPKEPRARTAGWIAFFVGSVITVTMTLGLENYIPYAWCLVELVFFSLALLTYLGIRAYRGRNWQAVLCVASFAALEIGLTGCVLHMSMVKAVFLSVANFGNASVLLGFSVPALVRFALRRWNSRRSARMASASAVAAATTIGLPT
jgi:hypothetical protein